jgi:hypothetical protein
VRESRDITQESPLTKWLVRREGDRVRKSLDATLERIETLVS